MTDTFPSGPHHDMVDASQVADVVSIQHVLYRYATALDLRRYEWLDEVFAPDATLQMSSGPPLSPAQYRHMCEVELGKLDATQHLVAAPLVAVDGDRATAHAYYQAQHVKKALDPEGLFIVAGWTDDELRRTDGRWRITARQWRSAWSSGNRAVLGG
jgi:hypothetical protein